ncbi:DNA protecting protein DprA [Acinetobacter sp. ANC 4654]|uniref:DNA-processing protein DprA n=1 Tax=Acinetobacter sp. ANC 4654 TaxID=1977872 RepID=UPI000A355EC4|nr:DNA-processing protein DprA [Acinetobacter sp. ANC 4654]OTG97551.1 DNA protecting protein DprA [Acinetobacter sp. ANC 4654]
MLNHLSATQIETITLWYLVQHSLSSFYKLEQRFGSVQNAIDPKNFPQWSTLALHKSHLQRLSEFQTAIGQQKFQTLLQDIQKNSDFILTLDHPAYPPQLRPYSDKPPILFGQGDAQALSQPQIAIVGSRKPSAHGRQVAYDFAYYLSEKGFYISSGLAQGIDEAAHQGALRHHKTIAVMGTGLEQTYPSQHQALRQQILAHSGTVITEFLPGTPPLQHHFPRRNRIVSALSLGVIVAEAALKSGSLITAKLAAEQGKLVFAIPGHIYSEHHQGCHQLIREGAILVDHPEQVLEDLALPTQWQNQQQIEQSKSIPELEVQIELPTHLAALYQQLDWVGQNIDELIAKLRLEIGTLTSQLMELELLGLCIQQAGLYLRCRLSK